MPSIFHNFLPFKVKKYSPDSEEIEPRPGLEPLDDPFDQPYDFPKTETELEELMEEELSEFHHSNMTFW